MSHNTATHGATHIGQSASQRLPVTLHYLYLLGMLAVIAAILTAAMVMQYVWGELPCPLCLLQRVALLGVCFGIMQQFRNGFSYQNTGLSLLFTIFLLVVSVRQTLLDIYPRPGHEYIGTAVFGLHMPVWSILIALALLIAYAFKLILWGGADYLRNARIADYPVIRTLATLLSLYVIAIALINFGSVVLQCGLDECHTFGYALLNRL
ncbi:disulfide bond formation protein DsbB [Paramesorhizobium deserti]|uniref:Disulfide bond formation protein DsbB n=1 Tax=Paramesorhizobium deserti TaxID=1494590 RepID=A0A135HTZ8_9HYPH|nr:disulfide bond formation protein B [Paramesorhizobium deserti]KXF76666.1 disulfide bond formation protein DsbB [Paramesorhizobium deserti]